jgi:hypothetical protein
MNKFRFSLSRYINKRVLIKIIYIDAEDSLEARKQVAQNHSQWEVSMFWLVI